jgi:hypothetical protein
MSEKRTIVSAVFGKKAPEGLSEHLRELADACDQGEVVELVACYIRDGSYEFVLDASPSDGLVLATLLHDRAIGKFKR